MTDLLAVLWFLLNSPDEENGYNIIYRLSYYDGGQNNKKEDCKILK